MANSSGVRPRRTYHISESNSHSHDRESSQEGEILAAMLETQPFSVVMKIVQKYRDGQYTILPYITRIQSDLETINPFNLTKCCRVKTLILPNCNNVNDNMLMMLPQLESLTIKAGSLLTGEPFLSSPTLKILQIISHGEEDFDTLIKSTNAHCFQYIEQLHMMNNQLRDCDFRLMTSLRVLILEKSNVTPAILNYLPNLELLIINKKLHKYVSSIRNRSVLKKIARLHKIQVYALENNIIL